MSAVFASFTDLPAELVLDILDLVDSRRDVTALASTCRTCFSVLTSDEIQYPCIYARSVAVAPLWQHLAQNPDKAALVRSLSIGGHGPKDHIPRGFKEAVAQRPRPGTEWAGRQTFADAEDALCAALKCMPNLVTFTWQAGRDRKCFSPVTENMIWDALRMSCRRLRTLVVEDHPTFGVPSVFTTSLFLLSNLQSVTLRISNPFPSKSQTISRLTTLLRRNHALHTLHITHIGHAPLSLHTLLTSVSRPLPALKALTLVHEASGASAVRDFFHRHAALVLEDTPAYHSPFLPNLRCLTISGGSLAALVDAAGAGAPIAELRGFPPQLARKFEAVLRAVQGLAGSLCLVVFDNTQKGKHSVSDEMVRDAVLWFAGIVPGVKLVNEI